MPRIFQQWDVSGVDSQGFCLLWKNFAVTAGWAVKGSSTGSITAYSGITAALAPGDQGIGGDYDCWIPSRTLRWVVLENDGRELLVFPKFLTTGTAQWVGAVYARKGSGGFDGALAGPSTLPAPPTVATDETSLLGARSVWGGNGGSELGVAAFDNGPNDWVYFWGHSQTENGARTLGYIADGGASTSFNSGRCVIAPVIASAQSSDDPDPVICIGIGTASTSFSNSRWWDYRAGSFSSVSPWVSADGGFKELFGSATDPHVEPTSGEPMVIQAHTGRLNGSSSIEMYKGPITENALVVVSSYPTVCGQLYDVGFADGEGVWCAGRSGTSSASNWLVPWPDNATAPGIRALNVRAASWRGIRAEGRDVTIPVVDNFSTPYALATQSDAITFDVTDIAPGVDTVYVGVRYGTGLVEAAYMRNAFSQQYSSGSSTSVIANGLRFTLARSGPWLGDFTVEVYAVDFDGNDIGPVSQAYTIPADVCYVPSIPSPDSSMAIRTFTLLEYRNLARDLSDMDNSDFVSDAEWNVFINLGLKELHDLLVESHDQEFLLKTYSFALSPPTNTYTLPADFHVLKGVDYSDCCFAEQTVDGDPGEQDRYDVQTTENTASVFTLKPYTFEERHSHRYNQALLHSDVWGAERAMKYRVFTESVIDDVNGSPTTAYFHRIRLTPIRAGYLQVWYIPVVPYLSSDTDFVPAFYGFEEYPAIYAALHALMKEESDIGPMQIKLEGLRERIRIMAAARDVGHPGRISDVLRGG